MVFGHNGVGESPVNFVVCADQPGPVRTLFGLDFPAPYGLDELEQADAIIVPGWSGIDEPIPKTLQQALCRAHDRKAHIVGLCLGVFVLAEAGLLDGRWATTHWLRSDVFAKRYPHVQLDKDNTHTRDGNIWTSAGGAAAIDTCLQLLQVLQGATAADRVARQLISGTHHRNKQLSCIEGIQVDTRQDGTRRMQQLLDWMLVHPNETQHLDALAQRVHMTVRTFTRRFKRMTGMTVGQWRVTQQLKFAQRLLKTSDATIEAIAQQTGFGLSLSLRIHFKKAFGMTPSAYRRKVR